MDFGRTISLTVPDGLVAQITICNANSASPGNVVSLTAHQAGLPAAAAPGARRRLIPLVVCGLVVVGFLAGTMIATRRVGAEPDMPVATPLHGMTPSASTPAANDSGAGLRALQDQLRTRPRIDPAPGLPAAPPQAPGLASGSANPFGLNP